MTRRNTSFDTEAFLQQEEVPEENIISLPVIPLPDMIIFPNTMAPIFISQQGSLKAVSKALKHDRLVFLVAQRDATTEYPDIEDLYQVGTIGEISQKIKMPDGSTKILVEGHAIAVSLAMVERNDLIMARILPVTPEITQDDRYSTLMQTIRLQFSEYMRLSEQLPEELNLMVGTVEDPFQLCNVIASYTPFPLEDKQKLLETNILVKKLSLLSEILARENELLKLERKINAQVKSKITKHQKEFFLHEQIKVIEKELGLDAEGSAGAYEKKIDESKMSDEAREAAEQELDRLLETPPYSPESAIIKTYLDWLIDLPWGKFTRDRGDLSRAQKILDGDHFGLEKIKDRILEHIAVLKMVKKIKGPILCFVGPPGVGKTSLARSIANTLNRKFVRVSLGGVHDEAEIRGHRRTYVGSLPGRIIQSMKKAQSMNPVFLLDEIDKMGTDLRGDPASALLEVLDPEQNNTFADHYLDVDFDLSHVMFITTANTTNGIPLALADRMEIIRLPGYTEDEKYKIAHQFLVPRQLEAHGLSAEQLSIDASAIELLIRSYTREAGVRKLDHEIASLCRKAVRMILKNKKTGLAFDNEQVRKLLGPEKYSEPIIDSQGKVGTAVGLAWTEVGGEILPAETTVMPGKGLLQLTGNLGEVMQESGRITLSYLRTNFSKYMLPQNFHKLDIHVHIPEGAVPKDGPSAGVTMATSMYSALTGSPVRQDLAMTGEMTLHGRVLKIGGLKEKLIAAHRNHIYTVLIPDENVPELDEINPQIREQMTIISVKTIDDIFSVAMPERAAREHVIPGHNAQKILPVVKRSGRKTLPLKFVKGAM